jgi:hypothetical protein
MKIVRSALAVLIGSLMAVVFIRAGEAIHFARFKPADAPGFDHLAKFNEWSKSFQEDPQKRGDWIKTLPSEAMILVLVSRQLGAFVGGFVSALIAGRARLVHAGIIGGLVLAGTILNLFNMKRTYGFSHADWMIVLGLLLPLPASLAAGKIVSILKPPPAVSNP